MSSSKRRIINPREGWSQILKSEQEKATETPDQSHRANTLRLNGNSAAATAKKVAPRKENVLSPTRLSAL